MCLCDRIGITGEEPRLLWRQLHVHQDFEIIDSYWFQRDVHVWVVNCGSLDFYRWQKSMLVSTIFRMHPPLRRITLLEPGHKHHQQVIRDFLMPRFQ